MMLAAARRENRADRERHALSDRVAFSIPLLARYAVYAVAFAAVALGPVDEARSAAAAFETRAIALQHAVPLIFGPETSASGAYSGGVGWLGALLLSASAALPLGAVMLSAAMLLGTLELVNRRARAVSSETFATLAVCVCALCCADVAHSGAPLTAPLFLATLLVVLDRATPRRALAVTGLVALWCNLSPSGLLGAAFTCMLALGACVERRPAAELGAFWLAAGGAWVATLTTPAGLAYPPLAFAALRLTGASGGVGSVAPGSVAPLGYHVGFMLLLVLALICGVGTRRRGPALPLFAAVGLGLANGSYVPLAGVVGAPLLAAAASAGRLGSSKKRAFSFGGLALVAGTLLVLTFARHDVYARSLTESDDAAALGVRATALHEVRRLACAQPAWCAAAVARGGHVLLDDRFERAPRRVRVAQAALATAAGSWERLARTYGIDALLVERDSPLASLLRLNSRWRVRATRGEAVAFVRNDAAELTRRPTPQANRPSVAMPSHSRKR